MRPIDADSLNYRRKDYSGYDDVIYEQRKRGILFLLEEDIAAAPTIDTVKHGKWESSEYLFTTGQTRCSDCKTQFYIDDLLAELGKKDIDLIVLLRWAYKKAKEELKEEQHEHHPGV